MPSTHRARRIGPVAVLALGLTAIARAPAAAIEDPFPLGVCDGLTPVTAAQAGYRVSTNVPDGPQTPQQNGVVLVLTADDAESLPARGLGELRAVATACRALPTATGRDHGGTAGFRAVR